MSKKFSLIFFPVVMIFMFQCCAPDPQQIVNEAITNSGWDRFNNTNVEFDFRGTHYKIFHNNGNYVYEKIFLDTAQGIIREGMTNDSTYKELNGLSILLDEKETARIRNSINQVVYFNLLPYKLNDKAVIKNYIGESTVNDKEYYKIRITFSESGGGDDYDDWYIYWFEKNTKAMDYFAYYYTIKGESATRFRVVKKVHSINGFIFYDWENFTSEEIGEQIENFDKLYTEGKVKKVSDIELNNIEVKAITE
ncbi:MAG: hypothetical protein F9K45_09035 [Melioribacteraceae bacterium]|nr:MAG: hypothetical protein F9K45_09035 [Melioribacteraceae bacterium]